MEEFKRNHEKADRIIFAVTPFIPFISIQYNTSPFKSTQLTFTCSKSLIETLEKCVKYIQSYQ